MPISAQSIIRRVAETLNDSTSVRWPVAELVRYLNDGQREVGTYRPDALVAGAAHSLAAGARQTLPANGIKLLDIVRNDSTSKRAIRQTNRQILDAQIPGWHNLTGTTEVLHFIYDPRDPLVFYVYPPAAASGASVYMIYASTPAAISEPAEGTTYTAVSGNIGVPDIYANALLDYILYRAYTKDTEYSGNAARATAHYQAFVNALTVEANATAVASPKG